jgi:hypothetical protein
MCNVEQQYIAEANRLYNLPFTYRANLSEDEIYKIFGGCYKVGDKVFIAQTAFKKKYILLRMNEPYTYADEDVWFGF